MKKLVLYLTMIVLLFMIVPISGCFGSASKPKEIYEKLETDILEYESLSIGYKNYVKTNPMKAKDYIYSNLYGIDSSGEKHEITYKVNDEEVQFFSTIRSINQMQNFIILNVSTNTTTQAVNTRDLSFSNSSSLYTYVIDKRDGNMYYIDIGNIKLVSNYFGSLTADCLNSFLIECNSSYYLCKIQDENLVYEKIISKNTLPGGCSVIMGDLHENIIIKNEQDYYVYRKGEQLRLIDLKPIPTGKVTNTSDFTMKSRNLEIYSNGKVLNSDGVLDTTSSSFDSTVLCNEYLVYSKGNFNYYFTTQSTSNIYCSETKVIYVVNKESKNVVNSFKVEPIEEELSYKKLYLNAPYIYAVRSDDAIILIDIKTGFKTELTFDEVIIDDFEMFGLGTAVFNAVDLALNNVKVYINEQGEDSYIAQNPNEKLFFYTYL